MASGQMVGVVVGKGRCDVYNLGKFMTGNVVQLTAFQGNVEMGG